MGYNFNYGTRKPNKNRQIGFIKHRLSDEIIAELSEITNRYHSDYYKCDELISNIARLVHYAEKLSTEMCACAAPAPSSAQPAAQPSLPADTPPQAATAPHSPSSVLPAPVRVHDNIDLSEITIDEFDTLKFETVGNRKTAYFGRVDYKYSKIRHRKQDYPADCPVIGEILHTLSEELDMPDLNE